MNRFEEILQILSSDSKDDKIKVLESSSHTQQSGDYQKNHIKTR